MTKLKGKTLFITGATRGIGFAIAKRAAMDGANIVIAAKTTEPHPTLPGTIFTAADELKEAGGNAIGIKTDIRFEEEVNAAVEQTVSEFGGIDICVNNASAISPTPTLQTDMKRYHRAYLKLLIQAVFWVHVSTEVLLDQCGWYIDVHPQEYE